MRATLLTDSIGGFLGAWLGGKVFNLTGNYDTIWTIGIVFTSGAALIHMPITEASLALKMLAA